MCQLLRGSLLPVVWAFFAHLCVHTFAASQVLQSCLHHIQAHKQLLVHTAQPLAEDF